MANNRINTEALASITDLSGIANLEGPLQQLVKNVEAFANLNDGAANLSNIAGQSFAKQQTILREAQTTLREAEEAVQDTTIQSVAENLEERKKQLKNLIRKKRTKKGLKEAEKKLLKLLEDIGELPDEAVEALKAQQKGAEDQVKELRAKLKQSMQEVLKKEIERSAVRKKLLEKTFKGSLKEVSDAFDVIDSENTSLINNWIKKRAAQTLASTKEGQNIIKESLSGKFGDATNLNYRAARAAGMSWSETFKSGGPKAVFSNFMGGLKIGGLGALALTGDTFLGNTANNNVFKNVTSGSQLGLGEGGLANKAISAFAPPWITVLLAALNRFNEIGKKALELFGATAGRYGYGEGFDQEGARRFLDFQSTARKLSAEYAVNLQEVEEAFKGLQEYSGVRTFEQLKKLAEATLEISNATGLATTEVSRLGSAYQKNFGYGAQESVSKAGKQLLGLMNSINSGLTSNLLVTNAEMAALVQNLIEGTQGADVTKTLIPFLDAAFDRVKDLGIQSRVVGDLLRNQMMEMKKSGAGLPGSLPSFMLAAGGLFTNRLGGAEAGIASQVGRGKFAYEQGQEMARITTGPAQKFWSSPKLILRNDLVDLAFKLKSNDLPGLLASQSDAALGQITQRIFELYQIPGAAEAIGVSLAQITEKFSTIARNNPLQFKLLGGDLDKLTALSEYTKAEATLRTGRVGGTGPMATEEQMKAASETRKAMVAQMTPVDRTNQLLEQLVGLVDDLVVFVFDLPLFGMGKSDEEMLARRGGLTEEEYKTLAQLTQIPQRDAEQQKQMDLLKAKQNEFRGKSTAAVNPVSGKVTTTIEMENPPYARSIAASYISGGKGYA